MNNYKFQISNFKFIVSLLVLVLITAYGCTKVDKPVRGEEGTGPMTIVIDGEPEDAPDSHRENMTSEGTKLVNPYSGVPVIGSLFKSGLTGLDFWKAYHPNLITGTHDPQLIVATEDEEELCLDCHDQKTSCNNCHGYVGVKQITSSEE